MIERRELNKCEWGPLILDPCDFIRGCIKIKISQTTLSSMYYNIRVGMPKLNDTSCSKILGHVKDNNNLAIKNMIDII